jgi:general secretion pathway protein G
MVRRRPGDRMIFFPWERKTGLLFGLRIARAKWGLVALVVFVVWLVLHSREERVAEQRSTRATLALMREGVDAYRAEHDGGCPPTLDALGSEGYVAARPLDAWGRPLRLECPSRKPPAAYDLSSDGPDGEPGGLDRVE